MIRVAEYVARTDTGHQRATNEDSHLARSPVFVVADGMGGAQAGEVASQLAITHFADGIAEGGGQDAVQALEAAVKAANAEIHTLSESDARRAGMGTTLTAAYVGQRQVSFAHVGDSRAYRLHDGRLERITEDHSLVEELLRQGRLTEEEAEEHPQRSIITRALGPEPDVEVDTFTSAAADGDIYLICSDGLTSMITDATVSEILGEAGDITTAAERLIAAALDAGGRDNVTVVLFRIEELGADELPETEALAPAPAATEAPALESTDEVPIISEPAPAAAAPGEGVPGTDEAATALEPDPPLGAQIRAQRGGWDERESPARGDRERSPDAGTPARRRAPRMPRARARPGRGTRRRRLTLGAVTLAVVAVLAIGALLATQAVYFIATDSHGQVTVYNGVPYTLPGGVRLYTPYFVSGVTAAELSPLERTRLFNNQLRSQRSATNLVGQLELGRIAGQ
jgi:PPM family protein phosphatase